MIRLTLLLTFILSSSQINAEQLKFSPKVPPYLKLLTIELFQSKKLEPQDIKVLNQLLNRNPGDYSFLDQEIIKYTLNFSKKIKKGFRVVDHSMYEKLNKKIAAIKDDRPFTKAILKSLSIDLGELLTEPELKQYNSFQRKKLSRLDKQTRKFSRKIALLTPWIRMVLKTEPEILENKLGSFALNLNIYIHKVLELTSRSIKSTDIPTESYVTIRDLGLESARKSLENLNFQVSPKPDPNYKAPNDLPQAVDDWVPVDETIIEDGLPLTKDELFPDTSPDYTPPKVLPKPVDSW